MEELEALADGEEVFEDMVSHLKVLSEDEKIRQQCEARADYESRLASQYGRGLREGREEGRSEAKLEAAEKIAEAFGISKEEALKILEK